ncbi:MAG: hypothetical protein U5K30_10745 [Acidimicrobiales bacterium]|nr:hypothetical protein [Acidimicrobiales bacterium]
MASDANSAPSDDLARYAEVCDTLVETVAAVVPGWIERLVTERVRAWRGEVNEEVAATAARAGTAARDDVVPALRALVDTDIDDQRGNPLALLRGATSHAHAVLADAGVPEVVRDQFAERSFPDDVYDLVPASWDEVDPSLHEIGITWGAAKAHLFKARRRAEGEQ